MNFRKLVLSASALALLVVGGCSSSSTSGSSGLDCGSVGSKNCPNDTAETQATVDQCNKCLSQEKTYASCQGITSKSGCGADGKSVAPMIDQNKCQTELKAVSDCFAKP
jgi:hypothetical protein